MKEVFCQYATYNLWANQRLLTTALLLSEEQQKQVILSSFKSIYETFLHMWNVESVWWQRMKLQELIVQQSSVSSTTVEEISTGLLEQSRQWEEWANSATEALLTHVFAYHNSKKEYFKQPHWQMLLHLFNHETYHRGQIVTMLKQLKIDNIPPTDFIVFSRKK
jgi:uncharacterized damage-inducible protein DinB